MVTKNISELHDCGLTFKDVSSDFFHWQKMSLWVEKWGQYQAVVITKVDTVYMVVDGMNMLKVLRQKGRTQVECIELPPMTRREFIICRLALTARLPRLNYLHIAEAVQEVCKNEPQRGEVATITHLKYDELKNYCELLTFDWDAFLKTPLDEVSLKLFEDER